MAGGAPFPKRPSSTSTPSKPQRVSSGSSLGSNSTKRNKSILSFFEKSDGPPPQATSRQPRITQFATASARDTGVNRSGNGNGNGSGSVSNSGNGTRTATRTAVNGSRLGPRAGITTGGLFLEDTRNAEARPDDVVRGRSRSRTPDDIWGETETGRFNENESSVKRQKTGESTESLFEDDEDDGKGNKIGSKQPKSNAKQSGPFIDESDSEEEDLGVFGELEDTPATNTENSEIERTVDMPSPVREVTSYIEDEETNFDALDEEGLREEFLGPLSPAGNECEEEQTCPICQTRLDGLSEMV